MPYFEDITVDYEPGTTRDVTMPDGSHVILKKLAEDYDPTDAGHAIATLREARDEMKFVTGLLYVDPHTMRFDDEMHLGEAPLVSLTLEQVRPPKSVLDAIMHGYREGSAPIGAGGG